MSQFELSDDWDRGKEAFKSHVREIFRQDLLTYTRWLLKERAW